MHSMNITGGANSGKSSKTHPAGDYNGDGLANTS